MEINSLSNALPCLGLTIYLLAHISVTTATEYCDTEMFRAECPDQHVIILEKATYGRMKIGRCIEMSLGYIGCSSDVISMADRRCSGRRMCEIRIPDAEFESLRPCLKELKTYLDASYSCVKVDTVTSEYCRHNEELPAGGMTSRLITGSSYYKEQEQVVITGSGYLASIVTSDTPYCDGTMHPWRLQASPGQKIRLTLYDFAINTKTISVTNSHQQEMRIRHYQQGNNHIVHHSPYYREQNSDIDDTKYETKSRYNKMDNKSQVKTDSTRGPGPQTRQANLSESCVQYGLVEDEGRRGSVPFVICGGVTRVRMVYESTGHVIRVWMTAGSAPTDLKRFVIKYTVTGCADPQDLSHQMWFRRTNMQRAVIGCHRTSAMTALECVENKWNRSINLNCTEILARQQLLDRQQQQQQTLNKPDKQFQDFTLLLDSSDSENIGKRAMVAGTVAGIVLLLVVIIVFTSTLIIKRYKRRHLQLPNYTENGGRKLSNGRASYPSSTHIRQELNERKQEESGGEHFSRPLMSPLCQRGGRFSNGGKYSRGSVDSQTEHVWRSGIHGLPLERATLKLEERSFECNLSGVLANDDDDEDPVIFRSNFYSLVKQSDEHACN